MRKDTLSLLKVLFKIEVVLTLKRYYEMCSYFVVTVAILTCYMTHLGFDTQTCWDSNLCDVRQWHWPLHSRSAINNLFYLYFTNHKSTHFSCEFAIFFFHHEFHWLDLFIGGSHSGVVRKSGGKFMGQVRSANTSCAHLLLPDLVHKYSLNRNCL